MELTQQERNIAASLLSQISVPVKDASVVIGIINKLQQPEAVKEEVTEEAK